jgi:hypothetical protein
LIHSLMDSPRRKGRVSQPNVKILSQILEGLDYPKKGQSIQK